MLRSSVHATAEERTRPVPGDAIIRHPADAVTHAITVRASPADVWPWLVRPSTPLAAGTSVAGVLGERGVAEVVTFEPQQSLVLGRREHGAQQITWSFVLLGDGDARTRLLVRVRSRHPLPVTQVWRQRRHLRELARQAERHEALLDRFLPEFDAGHHHAIHVAAAVARTFQIALAQDFMRPRLVRAVIGARAWALGAAAGPPRTSRGLVADMEALGWGVLVDLPGHELVMGAVTRPWEPSPTFRALPPAAFAAFSDPGYVKIVWSLRVDPDGRFACFVHTETRAAATDPETRRRFARYWTFVSRGTAVIRRALLTSIRREAEGPRAPVRRAS
jgi:hypothetical protein